MLIGACGRGLPKRTVVRAVCGRCAMVAALIHAPLTQGGGMHKLRRVGCRATQAHRHLLVEARRRSEQGGASKHEQLARRTALLAQLLSVTIGKTRSPPQSEEGICPI